MGRVGTKRATVEAEIKTAMHIAKVDISTTLMKFRQ
jgi:hypothetical protein